MRAIVRTALSALLLLGPIVPSAAADSAITADYTVSLSGINIASARVELEQTGQRYTLGLNANVSGLGQLVARGTASANSSGRASASALAAERFNLLTRANGEDFVVDIAFDQREVTAFKVEPPLVNNYDRIALERSHLRGVNDMIAAFVLKGDALDPALCRRNMQIFTGVERFDIAMSFAREDTATSARTGYQGPVILCNIRYKPVSGHFTSSEITNFLAQSDRIHIWYAPARDTGYFIPYRVLLTTSVGDLSMVLTRLD
ncbi:DUF3108 domain-containing protein [Arsenicitalea aurantiaca]|uniref:DUF3108 domain-containing protein n=1 Tax=Arsenicitalea aurantiaca TaxID=1783274 RepID=UPI00131508B4|nr:DUF3108 domain-containing protein [Arsenicitalea aurantiaca]